MDKTLTQAWTTVVVKEPSALFARRGGVSLGLLPKFQFKEIQPNYLMFHLHFNSGLGLYSQPALHRAESVLPNQSGVLWYDVGNSTGNLAFIPCKRSKPLAFPVRLNLKPLKGKGLFRGGTGLVVETWNTQLSTIQRGKGLEGWGGPSIPSPCPALVSITDDALSLYQHHLIFTS